MQVEKTVFISYRRTNVFNALAIYQNLAAHGFDVFFDYESIKSGSFEQIILNQIAARAHFVVLLTPSALERCNEPGDWLRREIEYAIDVKRNIVPLTFEGFSFKEMEQYLTGKLSAISAYNTMSVPIEYFSAAMDKLRNKFLNISLEIVSHPVPATDITVMQEVQANASQRPLATEQQMSAEEWFERGFKRDQTEIDDAIADYTEAIRLNPDYAEAYNNRGFIHNMKGDYDDAIADYTEAIRLNPKNPNCYCNRGIAYENKDDFACANVDYQKYIELGGEAPQKVTDWIHDNEERLRKL